MTKSPKKNIRDQVQEQLPDFAEECNALTADQINTRLAGLAQSTQEVEDAKEADEELEQAQAKASELGAPYRDSLKTIKLKTRYLLAIAKDRDQS